ncbi:hypothetical protein CDAR_449321 [Caerostris darwini]|uniref:Uncharacterized protein n=1 Tax=Caerostris darwini TaxID=1538125 RepID=A0AAV4QQL6_9ARAC|nr:hypothetical protein CDAR_449321 [Caerostris darwini]
MPQKSGVQRIFPTCENTCTDKRTEVRDDSNAGDNRHRFTTTAGFSFQQNSHRDLDLKTTQYEFRLEPPFISCSPKYFLT